MARWIFYGLNGLAAASAVGGVGYWLWYLLRTPGADEDPRPSGWVVLWTGLMIAFFVWLVALLFWAIAVAQGWWEVDWCLFGFVC